MKKQYHICKVVGGCFGAPGAMTRLDERYTNKAAAESAKRKLDKVNADKGTVYFIEWEWA